jgi:hypothetical protein
MFTANLKTINFYFSTLIKLIKGESRHNIQIQHTHTYKYTHAHEYLRTHGQTTLVMEQIL